MTMNAAERFAVEHPRARRVLVLLIAALLLGYVVLWSPSLAALVAAATGIAAAFVSRAADAAISQRLGPKVVRWTHVLSDVGAPAGAVASVVFWRQGSPVASLACAFLGGFMVVAAFLYPLPR